MINSDLPVVTIIDYEVGNLHSVKKAFEKLGAQVVVTQNPKVILSSQAVVLPGVGAFKDAMESLKRLNLITVIQEIVRRQVPFLGICLGLQLLFEESEEFGVAHGLSIIPGRVVLFRQGQKIPHLGWNQIHLVDRQNPLLRGIPENTHFYFVHSFYVIPADPQVVIATCSYGIEYACAIYWKNIFATQFHPEKSQKMGLRILKNFLTFVEEKRGQVHGNYSSY
jgi:glutamine amidotransferase